MSKTLKCITFKGNYTQMVLPIFAVMLLMATSIIYAVTNWAEAALPVLISCILIAGLGVITFLFIRMKKYVSRSMEVTESEFKFFDKSGQFKYSILFQDILSISPEPFFGFDDLNNKLSIRLKQGSSFTVLVTEEGQQLLKEKFRDNPVYDAASARKIPLYMHLLFGLSVLLLIMVLYIGFIMKESIGVREIGYCLVLGLFISYYINLRSK